MTDKEQPRKLTDAESRRRARMIRDEHWRMMELCQQHDPLWFCVWDKHRRHDDESKRPADLMVCGLLTGLELLHWPTAHPEWFRQGEWDDKRYARPMWLTEAGRAALLDRARYDMEPVEGGMVEPGWQAIPAERAAP